MWLFNISTQIRYVVKAVIRCLEDQWLDLQLFLQDNYKYFDFYYSTLSIQFYLLLYM